jgi:hypothetical protein
MLNGITGHGVLIFTFSIFFLPLRGKELFS